MTGVSSFFRALKRRKPIVELLRESNSSTSKQGLQRSLGVTDLILYGVGSSVGAGIYSLIGVGAEVRGKENEVGRKVWWDEWWEGRTE